MFFLSPVANTDETMISTETTKYSQANSKHNDYQVKLS